MFYNLTEPYCSRTLEVEPYWASPTTMIMIASLIYLGIFQIIFHKIIGSLSVATNKPLLECTEGMLKRIFSNRPTT